MTKNFPIRHLTQFVAKMYNKECPEYYAGHPVTDIRYALIEMFHHPTGDIAEISNNDIRIRTADPEHDYTLKQCIMICQDSIDNNDEAPIAEHMLKNINIVWDTIQEFKNNY
jgi:hypothetical protein